MVLSLRYNGPCSSKSSSGCTLLKPAWNRFCASAFCVLSGELLSNFLRKEKQNLVNGWRRGIVGAAVAPVAMESFLVHFSGDAASGSGWGTAWIALPCFEKEALGGKNTTICTEICGMQWFIAVMQVADTLVMLYAGVFLKCLLGG